jgi:hypothetical protein
MNFAGEEINPVYAELSCSVHENFLQDGISVNIPVIWCRICDEKPLIFTFMNFGVGF